MKPNIFFVHTKYYMQKALSVVRDKKFFMLPKCINEVMLRKAYNKRKLQTFLQKSDLYTKAR